MNATTMPVTNEMLYELLKAMQVQISNVETRLEKVETSLEIVETKLSDLRYEFNNFRNHTMHRLNKLDKIEEDLEKIRAIQLELWESRKEVKLGFTRGLLIVNGLISVVLSTIISLAFNKTV